MTDQIPTRDDNIECPLCYGQGQLTRTEVLERLGMRDIARVAQLSAEEVFRLLLKKHKDEENTLWLRFETELSKRLDGETSRHRNEVLALQTERKALEVRLEEFKKGQDISLKNAKEAERLDAEGRFQDEIVGLKGRIKEFEARDKVSDQQRVVELEKLKVEFQLQAARAQSEKNDLDGKAADHSREMASLRDRNRELETEISKVVRSGRKEEVAFAEEAQTWPGVWLSEKLKRNGDYLLAYRDPSGEPLEPKMLVDNKDKNSVTEDDVEKVIRDAREQGTTVAALITRDESQLRTFDKEKRWISKDGVWILRTTRSWFHRDLDILRPIFDTMRTEGSDFLEKNSRLAEEIRSSLVDVDEIERELKKAARAIESAKELVTAYRVRLQRLCDSTVPKKSAAPVTTLELASSA